MKEKPSGPELKRDANNVLDQSHASEVVEDLTRKLITEERAVQKEMSFRRAMNDKRDIIVKVVIYQRNTVDGKIVRADSQNPVFEKLSDEPLDPYRYRLFDYIDGEIFVREMPMPMATIGKWTMGMFKALQNYLARMNVMDRI